MEHYYDISIQGLVQGVGFRPFIYKLASGMGINGTVRNNNEGINIEIICTKIQKDNFIERVKTEKPISSSINNISIKENQHKECFTRFSIESSSLISDKITLISPDIAVCDKCMSEIKSQPHRINFPFINCTHCGPRFSIIRKIPYDRENSSMSKFPMCQICDTEYKDIEDRRFHAQATGCRKCGPGYSLKKFGSNSEIYDINEILSISSNHINNGNIVAIKGLGGYNLIADAFNISAVQKIRDLKKRFHKPLAIMARDINMVEVIAELSPEEKDTLSSYQRPVVLLQLKKTIDKNINSGLNNVGVILPYLPIHYMLFEYLNTDFIIFTSANKEGDPIITDNDEAEKTLLPYTEILLKNNRDIINRVDDSVVNIKNSRPQILRRSRGYVPDIITYSKNIDGTLALGSQINNSFAIAKDKDIIVSQYIGDLDNYKTREFLNFNIKRFEDMFKFTPKLIACDMHPGYYSTVMAETISKSLSIPLVKVQHHHAHAVAAMAEHKINDDTLAIVLDGSGYGTDGNIWGSEFLICNNKEFIRDAHFDYFALPGGEGAIKEPWKTAVSICYSLGLEIPEIIADRYSKKNIETIHKMINSRLNSPLSCGAGRIFDAVSSLIGLCDSANYQAQAAILLEQKADKRYSGRYHISDINPLNMKPLFASVLKDIINQREPSLISARFHNTIAEMIFRQGVISINSHHLSKRVVLTGGCFQNRLLSEAVESKFLNSGFNVIVPEKFSCNDGSIAIGQIIIAKENI